MAEQREPAWAYALNGLLIVLSFVIDVITYIPWKLSMLGSQYSRSQSGPKSVSTTGSPAGPYISTQNGGQLMKSCYGNTQTMDAAFERACKLFKDQRALGTRELLSETDEKQPNGKVFKKAVFGKYQWLTYGEMFETVDKLARGFSELGIKRVCLYMETRAEWMMTAHACFRHNIKIVTVYSTLGEVAVSQALNEAEVEVVITSASLLESKLINIAKNIPTLKTVVYAPHEFRHQKVKTESLPSSINPRAFDEVCAIGAKSKITENPNEPITPDTIAVIMYTSGTTGKPKGVMLSQGNVLGSASAMFTRITSFDNPMTSEDIWLAYLPLAHILELSAENAVLLAGIPVGFGSTLTISDRSSRIKAGSKGDASELRPTIMPAVPEISERIRKAVMANVSEMNPFRRTLFNFAYKYKLRHKKNNMPTPFWDRLIFSKTKNLLGGRLRVFISGGAPLDVKTQRFINICLCTDVTAGYGLTETSAGGSLQDMFDNRCGNVGHILDSSMIKLVDWKEGNYSVNDKPFPRGEILVGGNNVAHGYYQMPEKTKEEFSIDENGVRWFKTGDIGQMDNNGNLSIIDRKKDLVKLRHGEYLALGKIEAILKTSSVCENLCVFANQDQLTCVAVAVVNKTEILKIAAELNIPGEFEALLKNNEINKAVYEDFLKIAKIGKLTKQEIPSKIYLEKEPWTPESGLITDALKLKRTVLNAHYEKVVNQLYTK
ncbi:Oidioi.mRNA.OKI2018_I69.PAR.g8612.t1.cds [Oikopleura dioica]|uniref:long-chain-fatty-acid--CoA ligase n=1 Tax=Oikopleura dioica TaxID=34765 RepID=A0ABN7RK44_OIKDI|nr:Oidioi.mRNA.OKI2018_I69.PAR.g8612.t1.cds [Oikopleura dioica]